MMERFSSLVTKSRPWPVIGRTIFFTSDKNRPTRDEIYFIDFWRENLSMYRINIYSRVTIRVTQLFLGLPRADFGQNLRETQTKVGDLKPSAQRYFLIS